MKIKLLEKKRRFPRERRRRKIQFIISIIFVIQLLFTLWLIYKFTNETPVDPVHKNMAPNEN